MSTLKVGDWVYVKSSQPNQPIHIKILSIDENGIITPESPMGGFVRISDVEKITDEIQINHLENYYPFLK